MAANATASSPNGVLEFLVNDFKQSPANYLTVVGVLFTAILLHKLSSPSLDGQEPPLLKPRVPIIGHLIGIIKYKGAYLKILYDPSDKTHRQIATLPILGGKLYVVFDPAIIQSIYRKKALSFEPFASEFAQRELLIGNETAQKLKTTSLVPDFFSAIHPAMTGDHLHRMNANALNYVSKELATIGDAESSLKSSNLWLWLRDLITLATSEALYGPENPIRQNTSLIEDLWTFETGLNLLLLNIFPSITASKAHNARARLQVALGKYYGARKYDHEDAGQIVRARAGAFIKHDVPDEEIGHIELALLHVATSNTIPTLYWFFVHVFNRPDLVQRLREEVLPVAQHDGNNKVTIDVTILDQTCPLLVACYREAIRITNQAVGNRRVLEDTMVTDAKGKSYLLKKGENVQMSALVSHTLDNVWGDGVLDFKPERFMDNGTKGNSESEKSKRASFIPFGGGKSLCPGRNFAFAENLGMVSCLLLGFDVVLPDGPKLPAGTSCDFAQAAYKPVNNGEGFGVQIQRRKGWEKTVWSFVS
ncbi:hypothetical protein FSARC_5497 [Fusarium sarcochroum]|uniref:Prostacyclin synthase n=1 Tax=Fusarium sarcochroum TaxID=1208366 RepID=A0A8H4TZH6_9HYPO|nr:hypothetical protein FSARC_5497 [Fusarium sarcochroum]